MGWGCVVKAKSAPKVETVEEEPLPEVTEESVGLLTDDVCSAPRIFLPGSSGFSSFYSHKMVPMLLLSTDCAIFRGNIGTKGLRKPVEACRE